MKVYIDTREPPRYKSLFEKAGHEVEVKQLLVADFIIENGRCSVAFERKEIGDFVQSIRGSHLQQQLLQQEENFAHSFLLIIGSIKDYLRFANRFWTIDHHLGSLASLSIRYRTKILNVDNNTQAANLMMKIAEKVEDGRIVSLDDLEVMRNKIKTDDYYVKMLSCVPGVSLRKAHVLKERFPSFSALLQAKSEDIGALEGFGKVLSVRVKSVIK